MFQTLTITLLLTVCNTWNATCLLSKGDKLEWRPSYEVKFTEDNDFTYKYQWTVGLPDWGTPSQHVAKAIEECRQKGMDKAHVAIARLDPFSEKHRSVNVNCRFEFGQGT